MVKQPVSSETAEQALQIAKQNAKPAQTKEQTKLIAMGIQQGIAEYKKREKAKARERDKERKKALKAKQTTLDSHDQANTEPNSELGRPSWLPMLPWALLLVSWLGFAGYLWLG